MKIETPEELLKSWKRVAEQLKSNPLNVNDAISHGYRACLDLCIVQLEESLKATE